jgi:hypothetical protein
METPVLAPPPATNSSRPQKLQREINVSFARGGGPSLSPRPWLALWTICTASKTRARSAGDAPPHDRPRVERRTALSLSSGDRYKTMGAAT